MTISWKESDPDDNGFGNRNAARAYGLLLIGSHSTIERPIVGLRELQSIRSYIYSSYVMPSDTLLAQTGAVYVYDIEENQRFQQLRRCCEYQRKYGGIHSLFAISRLSNVDLADRVKGLGSQFRLLGEAGFGPVTVQSGAQYDIQPT